VPAPPEVIDAFESVMDIYFSGVRHRERAAFILCDNLIEMACKTSAKQHDYRFDMTCSFHDAATGTGVPLANELVIRIEGYRNTRNNLQHASVAATVDSQHCATAILDAVRVADRCWPNTSNGQFTPWMQCALRIVRLYSSEGDANQRGLFEETMRNRNWRGSGREHVRIGAIQIELGHRNNWGLALRRRTTDVQDCLVEVGVP
jgi:hypothetical protein